MYILQKLVKVLIIHYLISENVITSVSDMEKDDRSSWLIRRNLQMHTIITSIISKDLLLV